MSIEFTKLKVKLDNCKDKRNFLETGLSNLKFCLNLASTQPRTDPNMCAAETKTDLKPRLAIPGHTAKLPGLFLGCIEASVSNKYSFCNVSISSDIETVACLVRLTISDMSTKQFFRKFTIAKLALPSGNSGE